MFTSLSNFFRFHGLTNLKVDDFSAHCHSCGLPTNGRHLYANHEGECHCSNCVPSDSVGGLYAFAMDELCSLLDNVGIPYNTPEDLTGGKSLRFPWTKGDVICHPYSYGGLFGRFETMNFTADKGDVSGWLHSHEALEIILHDWNERNRKIRAERE